MSETPHIKNIFSAEEEDCLSLEQMVAYRDGQLLAEEKHYAERHLLNCELCEMGYEGVLEEGAEVVASGAAAISEAAWSRVATREKKRRRGAWIWISAAASVVLLIAVGLVFLKGPSDETMERVAQEFYKQPSAPPISGNERPESETRSTDSNSPSPDGSVSDSKSGDIAANESLDNQQNAPADLLSKLKDQGPLNESMLDAEGADYENAMGGARGKDLATKNNALEGTMVPAQKNRAQGKKFEFNATDSSINAPAGRNTNRTNPTYASGEFGNVKRDASIAEKEYKTLSDDFDDVAEEQEEVVELDEVRITSLGVKPQADRSMATATVETVTANDMKSITATDVATSSGAERRADKEAKGKSKGLGLSRSKKAKSDPGMPAKDYANAGEEPAREEEAKSEIRQDVQEDPRSNADGFDGGLVMEDAYNKGMDLYRKGHFAESASLLRKASADTPSNLQAHYYAAASFLNIEQPKAAQYHLERILAMPGNSLYADAEWFMAITYLKLRDRSKARNLLQKISEGNGKYSGQASDALKDL